MKNDPNKKGPITPDLAIGLMDTILAPEVVGTTKNWLGNTVERRVRRGYIRRELNRWAEAGISRTPTGSITSCSSPTGAASI